MPIRDIWIEKPADVPFLCIYSLGKATITKVALNKDYTLDTEGMHYGDGDGSLTKAELKSCIQVADKIKNHPTNVEVVHRAGHISILKNEETIEIIDSYLDYLGKQKSN